MQDHGQVPEMDDSANEREKEKEQKKLEFQEELTKSIKGRKGFYRGRARGTKKFHAEDKLGIRIRTPYKEKITVPKLREVSGLSKKQLTNLTNYIYHDDQPTEAQSPGKTTYSCSAELGPFDIYTRKTELAKAAHNRSMEVRKHFKENAKSYTESIDSKVLKSPPPSGYKEQQVILKAPNPRKNKSEKISRNQTGVMIRNGQPSKKASANAIATILKINNPKKSNNFQRLDKTTCEWLHIASYGIYGLKGQVPDNLVIGTYHANTLMIPVEMILPRLAKFFKAKGATVTLDAYVPLLYGTHVADIIDYKIIIKNESNGKSLDIPFKFNPLNYFKPQRKIPEITEAFFILYLTENIDVFEFINSDKMLKTESKPEKRLARKLTFDNENIHGDASISKESIEYSMSRTFFGEDNTNPQRENPTLKRPIPNFVTTNDDKENQPLSKKQKTENSTNETTKTPTKLQTGHKRPAITQLENESKRICHTRC